MKYISIEQIKSLHESIDFLSTFQGIEEEYQVGKSVNQTDRDNEKTLLLQELAKINKRREEIIKTLIQ